KVGIDSHWDPRGRISNSLMLFDNFFGFEIPSVELPLHQEIGPILSDTFPIITPEIDSFLTTHPRTLYFALGTNVYIPPQSTFTLLKSFQKLIDQNIIDGIIWATSRTNTSELLLSNEFDLPISKILNNEHPNFRHGGASSCHESIYNAKPILILPIMSDQFGNAEKLEITGMALRLSKFNLDIDDIILKVKRLLNEK
ncbi:26757_t:CDS:2, partial [Racocetra persica]